MQSKPSWIESGLLSVEDHQICHSSKNILYKNGSEQQMRSICIIAITDLSSQSVYSVMVPL